MKKSRKNEKFYKRKRLNWKEIAKWDKIVSTWRQRREKKVQVSKMEGKR